ncbi:hypothetical protein F511_08191 [Dorcoceras hygrometricum]|uniref:J domain-containing protein n=1 Tax=Dorcoceras hygrometricum TaxID=472368 RepID=A0A2Z7BZ26_9LAMI|nr:hypothetical protein F511_08191 [Dorcoceras hygrometricum]
MGTRKSGETDEKPEIRRYLAAAVYFLEHRCFSDCRSYALRAKESDPTYPGTTKILAIASVLSVPEITPTMPDYYTIFNLPRFEADTDQIGSSFETLTSILDPNVNPYPNSSEAFEVVLKGWSVLSNPLEKARFDGDLMRNLSGCPSESGGDTFWTMCPYCYYVYQFERVFEECCLRCTNGSCGRGFHAVPVGAPPADVVEKGHYWCPGFMPLESRRTSGDENGDTLWSPFGYTIPGADDKDKCNSEGMVGTTYEAKEVEDNEFRHLVKGKKMRSGGEASSSGFMSKCMDTEADILASRGSVVKETSRRRKSVAWRSKKKMGRGHKVDRNVARSVNDVAEEWKLHVNGNADYESGFGDVRNKDVGGGVEFFEGDDDVFVGVQSAFGFGIDEYL